MVNKRVTKEGKIKIDTHKQHGLHPSNIAELLGRDSAKIVRYLTAKFKTAVEKGLTQ